MAKLASQTLLIFLDLHPASMAMLMLLFLFTIFNQAHNYEINFDFTSFDSDSCSDGTLICYGSATSENGYLSLTGGHDAVTAQYQVGRVLYKNSIPAWPAYIHTVFTINISPFTSSKGGDGITFIMVADNGPSPPNSDGKFLGLMNESTDGSVVGQIAVELDTYKNGFDIDDNHVAIDTKSVKTPLAVNSLNTTDVVLKSGRNIKVEIEYTFEENSGTIQVFMAYPNEQEHTIITLMQIPYETIIPDSVYVGFTAATGENSERHKILNWNFTSREITGEAASRLALNNIMYE